MAFIPMFFGSSVVVESSLVSACCITCATWGSAFAKSGARAPRSSSLPSVPTVQAATACSTVSGSSSRARNRSGRGVGACPSWSETMRKRRAPPLSSRGISRSVRPAASTLSRNSMLLARTDLSGLRTLPKAAPMSSME